LFGWRFDIIESRVYTSAARGLAPHIDKSCSRRQPDLAAGAGYHSNAKQLGEHALEM